MSSTQITGVFVTYKYRFSVLFTNNISILLVCIEAKDSSPASLKLVILSGSWVAWVLLDHEAGLSCGQQD